MIETDDRNRGQSKTGKQRGSLVLRLSAASVLLLAATSPAAWAVQYTATSCEDIGTQESAQGTFDAPEYGKFGGPADPLNLDPDGDGVACNNPGNLVGERNPEGTASDLACVDFAPTGESLEESQAQAQAVLNDDPSDPNGLDADGDGVACEFEATSTGEVSFEDGSGVVVDTAAPADPATGADDVQCGGTLENPFSSAEEFREAGQAIYDRDPSDPNGLDADGDGLACEFTQEPLGLVTFEDGGGFIREDAAASPEATPPGAEIAPVTPPPGADSPVIQPAEPDAAVPDVAGPQNEAPEPDAEVAPVAPPSGADSPVFQPGEPDVPAPTAGRTERPSAPVSSAPRTPSSIRELPATGGSDLPLPVSAGGALLMGLGALMLAAQRRRS